MAQSFVSSWRYIGEEVFRPLAELGDPSPSEDVFVEIGLTLVRILEKRFHDTSERLQKAYAVVFASSGEPKETTHTPDADQEIRKLSPEELEFQERSQSIISQFANFRLPFEEVDDDDHAHEALDVLGRSMLPAFATEADILAFLDAVHELLCDEYSLDWAKDFAILVEAFIEKFNLGYKLRPPFRIVPLISAQAARIYDLIQAYSGPHEDHAELWAAFEEAYHQFVRQDGDRKTPIHKITSYLEAVAADRLGVNRDSLGEVLKTYESRGIFPHKGTLKTSLSTLYGFTSDFPGIRHPGNPTARNRELLEDDTLMLSFLLFVWAGYLHTLPVTTQR